MPPHSKWRGGDLGNAFFVWTCMAMEGIMLVTCARDAVSSGPKRRRAGHGWLLFFHACLCFLQIRIGLLRKLLLTAVAAEGDFVALVDHEYGTTHRIDRFAADRTQCVSKGFGFGSGANCADGLFSS